MNSKNFYITTTTPYVNADPHIGFALEIVQADAVARYKRLSGYDVCFNWGTDEHGLKIYRAAQAQNKDPKTYSDEYAARFKKLIPLLNLSSTNFIRTTDDYHVKAAQEFWKLCLANGDIYKKNYKTKYCVGCELEKTDSELVDGRCPIHPTLDLEIIEEENYFFRFNKYQKKLLEFYNNNSDFVIPQTRYNELRSFVESGPEDFSISRLKTKMPWGVDVPDDPKQVMYVWFDALVNYISTIGWPNDEKQFHKWWPVVQVAGKDNTRQQCAIWQAMLMSAGLPNSKQVFIHGFITSEGQRMSKSLGNVVSPFDLVEKYGVDPVRYYLLREIPPYDDGDYSDRRFKELYNADLANGLGNLVARACKLAEKYCDGKVPPINRIADEHPLRIDEKIHNWKKTWKDIDMFMPKFRFNEAIFSIWKFITEANKYINDNKPWELAEKNKTEFNWVIYGVLDAIHQIAWQIYPFLPETATEIAKRLNIEKLLADNPLYKDSWTNIKPGTKIETGTPLFPRIS